MHVSTKKWLFTKISSLTLIPLMIWFIITFVSIYDKEYNKILEFDVTINFLKNNNKIISIGGGAFMNKELRQVFLAIIGFQQKKFSNII